MKKYLYIAFILLFGCSSIKHELDNTKLDIANSNVKYVYSKFDLKPDQILIHFTSGFEDVQTEIFNGNKIVYNNKITTVEQLGLASVTPVTISNQLTVKFRDKKNYLIKLDKKGIVDYKFIYISRDLDNTDKFLVEYSNMVRSFY